MTVPTCAKKDAPISRRFGALLLRYNRREFKETANSVRQSFELGTYSPLAAELNHFH